jgi:signal transduction histidine kinase
VAYRSLDTDARLRQRLLDDLREAQGDLAEAQHRAGTLAERARLSREIHDSVAQGLSSINLLLQAAEQEWDQRPALARSLVGQAAQSARDGLEEARRLVRDLAPAPVPPDPATLPEALAHLAQRSGGTTGLQVDLRVHGEPLPLPEDVAVGLLQTARGALANVAEHAAAQRVTLTLTFQDNAVSLDVRDDGRGFDPETVPPPGHGVRGRGLSGMRSRIHTLGGQLVVESASGEGTVVAASVPLVDRAEPDRS